MTTPAQPPNEQPQEPPQEPPPPSVQIANTEAMLDQAETNLAPIIVGAIMASSLLTGGQQDTDYGPSWGVLARGVLVPATAVIEATVAGFRELVRGAILNALIPLIAIRLRVWIEEFQVVDGILQFRRRTVDAGDLRQAATEAAEFAVDHAADALEKIARGIGTPSVDDFYGQAFTDDVYSSPSQRRAEVFAQRTARWMAREGLFRAQEKVAARLGFTHKRWISERDSRVRREHRYLDGKAVPRHKKFKTQTGDIRYPGDVLAPPHLWINCRCSLEWIIR